MNKRIYIAGPVTGVDNYKENFEKAVEMIRREYRFLEPVDPTEEGLVTGASYRYYINRGFRKLMDCDCIAMLPGWAFSQGSRLELEYAIACKLPIFYISRDIERLDP